MGGTYRVAVVGATGAVGQQMVACLEERNFPVARLVPLASERSLGKNVTFLGKEIAVEVLNEDSFDGVEIALFSAGGGISKEYGPIAARAGAVVVDNSSAWRMDPEVPLVVPEVNPQDIGLYTKTGIIANPNCSTIQMVVALKPLHDAAQHQAGGGVHLPGGVRHRPEGEWTNWRSRCGRCCPVRPPKIRSIRTASPSTACPTSTSSWRTATPRKR